MYIAAETTQLSHDDRAVSLTSGTQGLRKLRTAI
jgi:hypothetical protein